MALGARQLKELKLGQRVKPVRAGIVGTPRMVITGDKLLVDEGIINAKNDTVMHPRTAVGIDRDTGEVLLLVVDGRSVASRGYTMVELADLMIGLGADEALNLDGGGSSTHGDAGRRRRATCGQHAVRRLPAARVQRSRGHVQEALAPGTSTSATVVIGAKHCLVFGEGSTACTSRSSPRPVPTTPGGTSQPTATTAAASC